MDSVNIPLYEPRFLSRDWLRANQTVVRGAAIGAAFSVAVGTVAALATYYIPSCDVSAVPQDVGHYGVNADVEIRLGFERKLFKDIAFRTSEGAAGLLQSSTMKAPVIDFDPSTGACNIITDPAPYMQNG